MNFSSCDGHKRIALVKAVKLSLLVVESKHTNGGF